MLGPQAHAQKDPVSHRPAGQAQEGGQSPVGVAQCSVRVQAPVQWVTALSRRLER